MITRTIPILLATSLAIGTTGCFPDFIGGDGSSSNGDTDGYEPGQYDVKMDAEHLIDINSEIIEKTGADPIWSLKLVVHSKEVASFARLSVAELITKIEHHNFKSNDIVNMQFKVYGADGTLLATNVSSVADTYPQTKAVWKRSCSDIKADIDIADYLFQSDTLAIEPRLCVFEKVVPKDTVSIPAQQGTFKKNTVIYDCIVNSYYMYHTSDPATSSCSFGYQPEAGETPPVNTVYKDFAPGGRSEGINNLAVRNLDIEAKPMQIPYIVPDFSNMPFGSAAGCHTAKFDMFFNGASGVEKARLTFQKRVSEEIGSPWLGIEANKWPDLAKVKSYYSSTTADIHIYFICEWIDNGESPVN